MNRWFVVTFLLTIGLLSVLSMDDKVIGDRELIDIR
uniref:ACP134 n=1 Tax=Drosophila yakuba TaxID=7245 RepID=Q20DI6_DROYA|nr:ACP134 [Drosophila yakuba]ABD64392.1 ACP134 [Drosophila yakuba]